MPPDGQLSRGPGIQHALPGAARTNSTEIVSETGQNSPETGFLPKISVEVVRRRERHGPESAAPRRQPVGTGFDHSDVRHGTSRTG